MKEGYDPVYGARPLRRTVQRRIENPLAKRILAGDFADGDVVRVDYDGEEFTFGRAEAPVAEPEREAVPARTVHPSNEKGPDRRDPAPFLCPIRSRSKKRRKSGNVEGHPCEPVLP